MPYTAVRMRRRQFLLSTLLLAAAGRVGAQPLKPWAGVVTPPLELADLDGKTHRLADYRGKAVLINFWATWCKPCRDEMPSIERLRVSLQDQPFSVLAVNVGESAEAARRFADTMPLGFPLLLDRDTRTSRAWGARILPATFLVGPDGVARFSYLGELDWAQPEVRAVVEKLIRR
jgi:peroxiredoxin